MKTRIRTVHDAADAPLQLSLVPDHILLETYREYQRACAQLDAARLSDATVSERATALREATLRIEDELHARGIGDVPWWAEGHHHRRQMDPLSA